MGKTNLLAVGLMSGTSADGISAVVTQNDLARRNVKLLAYNTYAYPRGLQNYIHNLAKADAPGVARANFYLGKLFANAANKIIKKSGLSPNKIDVIGSHGQTICHLPDSKIPATLQIAELSVIAEKTGITTVADFRCRDIAAGGQGAPLVPYLDWFLFSGCEITAVQNIGGIANVSIVSRKRSETMAFDTGPGNVLIDEAMRRITKSRMQYDKGGNFAKKGIVLFQLLDKLLQHPYFGKIPPKSCDRNTFLPLFERHCASYIKKCPYDLVATLTFFTAKTITDSYNQFVQNKISKVIVSGGGAFNPVIMDYLKALYSPEPKSIEKYEIHPLAKEPMAFALLACNTIRGLAGNIRSATGAKKDIILGKIVPGRNFARLMKAVL